MNDSWPIPILHDDPCLHPLRDEAMKMFNEEGGSFAIIGDHDGKRVQISVRELDPTTEFVDEAKVQGPDDSDVDCQLNKLRFAIKDSHKELLNKLGSMRTIEAAIYHLELRCENVAKAIKLKNQATA